MRRHRLTVVLHLVLLLALTGINPTTFAAGVSEYQIKAAILYNFASFTKWPETAAQGMNFCVLGRDPFGELIDVLENKTVQGGAIKIVRLRSEKDAGVCRLLYISDSESDRLEGLLAGLQGKAILTLSDIRGAARRGVMVEMALDGPRLVFEINLRAAKDAGVELSSRLLSLARKVHGAP